MNRPMDLKEYGIKKIIDGEAIALVDYSGVDEEKGKFVLTFEMHSGEKITVKFSDKSSMQHVLDGIANSQIKL